MKNYRDLKVWKKSYAFSLRVYKETQGFPKQELYGLVSQMRRAATSIPSNIAEGCGRNSDPQLAQFFNFARGSASELDLQLLLSKDLGFLAPESYHDMALHLEEVQKMLGAFLKTVNQTNGLRARS